MQITPIGFVLLLLAALNFPRPERLLHLVFLAGVFGAASAFTLGGLGIGPNLVPASAFAGFVALQMLLGVNYPGERAAVRTLTPLLLLAAYGLCTGFLMPLLFAGQVWVHPQKLDAGTYVPLSFGSGNLNQCIYLVVNMMFLTLTSMFLTRASVEFRSILNAYFCSGFLIFAFAVWHLANRLTGIWYPSAFLYSNPGAIIFTGQEIGGGVPRINGSFTEPAVLGGNMATFAFTCTWVLLKGHRSRAALWLLLCSLFGVAISTSTSGFGALATGAAWLVVRALVSSSRAFATKVFTGTLCSVVAGGLLFLTVSTLAPNVETAAGNVFSDTLDKTESSSYQDRTTADADSLATLAPTYGFGVGWGSNRSSSLGPGLLASLGIYGCLFLPWFGARLLKQVNRVRQATAAKDRMLVIDAMLASLFGDLVTSMFSGPTITDVSFFLKLAIVVGCASRLEAESALARHRMGAAGVQAAASVAPVPSRNKAGRGMPKTGVRRASPEA